MNFAKNQIYMKALFFFSLMLCIACTHDIDMESIQNSDIETDYMFSPLEIKVALPNAKTRISYEDDNTSGVKQDWL